ncbi:MAG: hypothetical protein V3T83_04630, partial [Acidobacteriota bacterium]
LQPDMVVIEIELNNDITDEALIERRFHPRYPRLPCAVLGGRYVVSWDGNLLASYTRGPYLLERTYVYTDLVRRFLNLADRISPNPVFQKRPGLTYYTLGFDRWMLTEQRIESGWQSMFDALQATHRFVSLKQIPFLLMIMPSRFVYQDQAPQQRDFARGLVERAVEMSRQRDLPFVDLSEPIRQGGGAALFFDFAHLTVEGNRIVGERLAQEAASLLKLD